MSAKFLLTFFLASVGSCLGQNAILSRVGVLTEGNGKSVFSHVVFATFFPSLFVSLIQAQIGHWTTGKYDTATMRAARHRRLNFIQSVGGYIIVFFCLLSSIVAPRTATWIVTEAFLIGASTAVVFNAMQQTAGGILDEDQRQKALVAFSLGYQLSGIIVYLVDEQCGSRIHVQNQPCFFFNIGAITFTCAALCIQSHRILEEENPGGAEQRNFERESYFDGLEDDSESLIKEANGAAQFRKARVNIEPEPLRQTVNPLIPASLFITVTASSGLLPFYAHFHSRKPDFNLPQSLFFMRLASDAFARPSTLFLSRFASTARVVFFLAIIRLILVAPLLAMAADASSSNDKLGGSQTTVVGVLVCAFSAMSGFIVTRCYQVALTRVHQKAQPSITSHLNTVFSAALTASAVLGLLAGS